MLFCFTLGSLGCVSAVRIAQLLHLAAGSPLFTSPTWSGLGSVAKAGASQRAENARLGAKDGGLRDSGSKDSKEVSV